MEMTYSQRLSLLYGICLAETRGAKGASTNLEDYEPLEAATYLACYISFKAIQHAERSPADERIENFDMLSVYQAYTMLVYAYLMLPLGVPARGMPTKYPSHSDDLGDKGIAPDLENAAVTIAKSLFAELSNEEWAEIIESGDHKFQLIGDAEQEHWMTYREDMDKAVIAFVIAGTDENSPFDKDDLIPLFGALLSMLCEAFASE